MTNPNNAIGTNGAYGGRTSVNAFNDNLAIYQGRGILSGFAVSPNAGMSVAIGGNGTTRDVAIAEDNIGNKTTINNISESPVVLNIAGAPASNSRIDAIVAYVDNPAQGIATETDNPSACGLIDVQGAVSASPSRPDENAIRTAITADGASGTTAYYVVLGYITIANGTTDITSEMINQGNKVSIGDNLVGSNAVADGAISSAKINATTLFTSQAGQGLGSFTLSDAIENYTKLEIEYADVNGTRGLKSFRVVPGSTNQITLTTFQPGFGDAAFYVQSALVAFSGTSGNVADSKGGAILNGSYPSVAAADNIKVLSVVGYK